jgi:hypothetical protein
MQKFFTEGEPLTLVVAWIRRASANEELVVACDSRLTGGLSLDHAQA